MPKAQKKFTQVDWEKSLSQRWPEDNESVANRLIIWNREINTQLEKNQKQEQAELKRQQLRQEREQRLEQEEQKARCSEITSSQSLEEKISTVPNSQILKRKERDQKRLERLRLKNEKNELEKNERALNKMIPAEQQMAKLKCYLALKQYCKVVMHGMLFSLFYNIYEIANIEIVNRIQIFKPAHVPSIDSENLQNLEISRVGSIEKDTEVVKEIPKNQLDIVKYYITAFHAFIILESLLDGNNNGLLTFDIKSVIELEFEAKKLQEKYKIPYKDPNLCETLVKQAQDLMKKDITIKENIQEYYLILTKDIKDKFKANISQKLFSSIPVISDDYIRKIEADLIDRVVKLILTIDLPRSYYEFCFRNGKISAPTNAQLLTCPDNFEPMRNVITSVTEEYKKEVELATQKLLEPVSPSSRVERPSSSQSRAHAKSK